MAFHHNLVNALVWNDYWALFLTRSEETTSLLYIFIYIFNTYIYMYGIHHSRIAWSSYIKLACVGYEPTTTEFHSDALADWAICL